MNDEQFEALLAEFMDGQMSAEQHRAFLEAAAQNPAWGRRLVALLRFDPLISDCARGDVEGEGFLRRVKLRVETAGDSARFARTIVESLREREHRSAPVSNISPRYRPLFWAAAATVLLMSGILLRGYLQSGAPEVASLQSVKGRVLLIRGGVRSNALGSIPLNSGDSLETEDAGSEALIGFPDGTTLKLDAQSAIAALTDGALTGSAGTGKTIQLTRGRLSANVAKQPQDRPMLIMTATARVKVLGTRFVLENAANATKLTVDEGLVELTRTSDEKSVKVSGGEFVLAPVQGELAVKPTEAVIASLPPDDGIPFTSASFMGGAEADSIVGAEIQSDGTIVFAANMNGGAVVRVSENGSTVLSRLDVDSAVSDLAIDSQDNIFVATKTIGVVKINPQGSQVIWKSPLAGECRRVDAGTDGTCAASFKMPSGPDKICVIDSNGNPVSQFTGQNVVADVAINSALKLVYVTGSQRGDPLKGEMGSMAYLVAHAYDGLPTWTNYGYPLAIPTPDRAHTEGCRVSMGRDGKLYASFLTVGGNNIFRYKPGSLQTPADLISYDGYNRSFGSNSTNFTFISGFDPANGDQFFGEYLIGRDTKKQAVRMVAREGDIKADENGRVYLAGAGASNGPVSPNAVGASRFTGTDGFFFINNPNVGRREFFTHFTRAENGNTSMRAVAARVLPGRTQANIVVAGESSGGTQAAWTRNALQAVSGGGVDGYFAVKSASGKAP